ncbi:hypothetical protein F4803DRAFT_321599 [Xylaria telfairii]|nr:hypothetical protein F4803DRAFT_321599 [Xylaria telfairii]
MALIIDVMCPKTKTKSKKTARKCPDCRTRKIAREELSQMYLPPGAMAVTYWNQTGYDYGYSYGYGDWSTWEDNSPAVISKKGWKDHTQAARNAYESAQENGKKMGEVKSAITSEIKEVQKAIKETHASLTKVGSYAESTRAAIDQAHLAIQDTISHRHAEHMSKQEECAADIARVRQLLEEEARQREEARRLQEMVRYAQSQGLLQTPVRDRDHHRSRSSRSSSPATSTKTRGSGRSRAGEEREAERQRQREREKEQERDRERERERLSRTEGQLEFLTRRDAFFHHPRFQGPYYDDAMEAPLYTTGYPYADYGAGHRARGQPRCGNARPWDH